MIVDFTPLTDNEWQYGSIHNELTRHFYKFSNNVEKGFEKDISILLDMTNKNKMRLQVAYERIPSFNDHDFQVDSEEGGSIRISIPVGSAHYYRQGTYYMRLVPQGSFFQKYFTDDYYNYRVAYQTNGDFQYIDSQDKAVRTLQRGQTQVFRYIVQDSSRDLTFSLHQYAGRMNFKGKTNEQDARRFTDYDLVSRRNIKSESFTAKVLTSHCQDKFSVCLIYLGVQCFNEGDNDCQYSLKDTSNSGQLEQILIGSPIQSTVDESDFNYYYITYNEKHITEKPVYFVLNTLQGDADLYISFQENSNLLSKSQWKKPNVTEYDAKSILAAKQDVVKLTSDDLKGCIRKSKKSQDEQPQCTMIVGVFGKPLQGYTQYSLVAYVNIQNLDSDMPVQATIEANEFQYFIYNVQCDDCNVIIGVQSFSSGDPDLYIRYGQDDLPSLEQYDMKSDAVGSEVFTMTLKNDYFKKKGLTSMKGAYILGVFGKLKSTFVISATQNNEALIQVQEGVALQDSVKPYSNKIYQWFKPDTDDDIRVQVSVTSGRIDAYFNTFDESEDKKNIVQRLPKTRAQSIWTLESIKPTSHVSQTEIVFQRADRGYCQSCLYLIGIHAHEDATDFKILVEQIDANFQNSHFLKIGQFERYTIESGSTEVFKFIIDEKTPFAISQVNKAGDTDTFISPTPQREQAFDKFTGSSILMYSQEDTKRFFPSQMYYIIVENNSKQKADITLQIIQKHSVTVLQNGVPQVVYFADESDVSKGFALKLPKGQSTLNLQIQPIRTDLKPVLYYNYYENPKFDSIDFPPNGDKSFMSHRVYEEGGYLQLTKKLSWPNDNGYILFSIYGPPKRDEKRRSPIKFVVFASTQKDQLLVKGQQLVQTMFKQDRVSYLKLDQEFTYEKTGDTVFEFTNCWGDQNVDFLTNPEDGRTTVKPNSQHLNSNQGTQIYRFKNPIPQNGFYAVIQATGMSQEGIPYRDGFGERSQFMVKAYQSKDEAKDPKNRILPGSNFIEAQKSTTSKNIVHLDWQPLTNHTDVQYFVLFTQDVEANLESLCVMNADVISTNNYQRILTTETSKDIGLAPGKKYKINIAAKVLSGPDKGYIYTYNQFVYQLQGLSDSQTQDEEQGSNHIFFVLCFILLAIGAAVIFWFMGYQEGVPCSQKIRSIIYRRRIRKAREHQQHELGVYAGVTGINTSVDYNPPTAYEIN